MSLKAGRVGVAPSEVDEFGQIIGEITPTNVYTKEQTKQLFTDIVGWNNPATHDPVSKWGYTRKEANVLGAKNRFYIPSSVVTETKNGVTFTVTRNSAGIITEIDVNTDENGATANTTFLYVDNVDNIYGGMIFSGCPINGSGLTYRQRFVRKTAENVAIESLMDYGEGVAITDSAHCSVLIDIFSGCVCSHLKFYPMLRIATDPDDTFEPYAMTNRDLTDMVTVLESECTDIVSGATVNDNAMGNHLVKVGNVVTLHLSLSAVTVNAWSNIATIPNGFKPKYPVRVFNLVNGKTVQISVNGILQSSVDISNEYFDVFATWITE